MRAVEENVVVEQDGVIALDEVPVKAGDRVRVILLIPDEQPGHHAYYPLRGKEPYRFDDPMSPVAPEDWESAK
jgi:hypothetical protein